MKKTYQQPSVDMMQVNLTKIVMDSPLNMGGEPVPPGGGGD